MIVNLSENNNIISDWLRELQDVTIQSDSMRFRRNIERIGEIIGYEISKNLPYKKIEIETPIEKCLISILETQPILCTILRAGIPLFQGLLNVFDKAECSFIASSRQHTEDGNLFVNQQYVVKPSLNNKPLIIADTMLASGSSFIEAIDEIIKDENPSSLHIVSVIASPEGIKNLEIRYPYATIYVATIGTGLTDKGYIKPGLGDAGDLSYGKKI